jgi:hypothetical protein
MIIANTVLMAMLTMRQSSELLQRTSPGFWMASVNAMIFHALPPYGYAPNSELDVVELRGEKPTFVSSNIHENGKGDG